MSKRTIIQAEEQLRSALLVLDRETPVPRQEADRLIILAADMADSARRIRSRMIKFKMPDGATNDNSH
jgi:hypothetical protein